MQRMGMRKYTSELLWHVLFNSKWSYRQCMKQIPIIFCCCVFFLFTVMNFLIPGNFLSTCLTWTQDPSVVCVHRLSVPALLLSFHPGILFQLFLTIYGKFLHKSVLKPARSTDYCISSWLIFCSNVHGSIGERFMVSNTSIPVGIKKS